MEIKDIEIRAMNLQLALEKAIKRRREASLAYLKALAREADCKALLAEAEQLRQDAKNALDLAKRMCENYERLLGAKDV